MLALKNQCSLDEKHPVLRVGDAEGARDSRVNLAPIAASKSECAIETAAIGSYFNVADMFDVPPLQGASLMVRSQG